MRFARSAVLTATVVGAMAFARAAELPIVAKARAYVGSETALQKITTIHFTGHVTIADPDDAKKQTTQAVEIVLQKPDRERVTVTSDEFLDVTGINGFEAWHRVSSRKDVSKWQQEFLPAGAFKRLRAQVLESVNFFRGCEKAGGTITDEGPMTKDGVACRKVVFAYAPDIVFNRYFAVATGRLVRTETTNSVLKEQGEIVVEGVRFPKSMVQVSALENGKTQTVVTTFDRVTVNDVIPDSYFDAPPLTRH